MAEKEVKVKVTTETDIKDVEDLENKLQELQDTKLQMQLEADTAELEEVNSQIEETQSKLDELRADPTVDDSEIQALEDELAELEGRQIDLEIAVNTAELDQAKASMDELESSSKGASSSIDGVGSALTAVAATAGLDKMVETADNIQNSWNRLSLTFAGTGVSIDQLKQKQNELSASTGQTGSTIRNFFNDMGIAGVTNTNLLGSAFESLAGKAYQTGQSVEEMESKFQRMVMSGNASSRMLVSMGITAQDLANAMGVSADQVSEAFKNMTPEERIQALTKAMGDGRQANEMYKNSFQGLKKQAEAAFAGLVGAVGKAILPVVVPMLKTATKVINGLTEAFNKLPEPVRQIIGGIGGFALAATAIIGVLGVVGSVIQTVMGGLNAFSGALSFLMANPIVLVIAAIVLLVAALVYLYYTNEDVRKAIDGFIDALVNIGQSIYNVVIGPVQKFIDTLTWLYDILTRLAEGDWTITLNIVQAGAVNAADMGLEMSNNDVSRGIVSSLLGPDALTQIDEYMPAFQEKMDSSINDMLTSIWDNGTQGFIGWLGNLAGIDVGSYLTGVQTSFGNIPIWVSQAGADAIQGFQTMATGILTHLNKIVSDVITFGSRLVSNMGNSARNAVSQFTSGISRLGNALRDELNGMLSDAANFVGQIGQIMWNAAVNAWNNFLNGLQRHSPGIMMREFKAEMVGLVDTAKDVKDPLGDSLHRLATTAVNSFGNPDLSFTIDGTIESNNNMSVSELVRLLGEVLNALKDSKNNGNISNTFVLNGDIDNEERMQKFIDAVIREMEWDNKTAGRDIDKLGV